MRRLVASKDFENQVDDLPILDQEKIQKAVKTLLVSMKDGVTPKGLGLKKLAHDKYEIRVDLKTRIVLKDDGNVLVLILVGSHDQIKKHLKTTYEQKQSQGPSLEDAYLSIIEGDNNE